ncbi:PREDICTED: serine/threonine-protein phosphatase 4 regulatory subunit 2 [Dufourea novaeangliae]|uniref:Serine/threonine-protein phosphatase 4 regulatory subunit 2 n=1 Tax=Dufourea novaeangliae TaxID=178035 RepID=A0A154PSD9_DUFNO|nr:PREDICTED: serine/threonine-protein phosphatase 4 regulatory subunit 2 [Dufourea novaeangliae]KZC14835.1 Serine/threonine-protein phosphatase 4 regulatory subunit 2 [Dufourea novaeangliae]
MENLEEVLQALDEFQKMRPSEIPRELEDYLCWVAKTGDPVYQWSLIKTLFREKLTRVMTDFYESCPTLELAPCPNVEHFNYDTMKSNLLERLESFANAPFTVQRICELLTAPRKEYNRVDKFMRAIEKNILVVSTREPGPIARRNENGDGMVNGSVDEDASTTQPPDVEMEYWEKDCPSTVTISVHTVENEASILHTVVPTTGVVKNIFGSDEASQEKAESTSPKVDSAESNFIPTTSEFSGVPNLTSQTQSQEPQIGPTIQNLTTIVPETSAITGDVPEGIMNEDTSSQPSLDLENEDEDGADSTRKLQTTFQTKDFGSSENKVSKYYSDNSKVNEKTKVGPTHIQEESNKVNDTLVKDDVESKAPLNNKEVIDPAVDNLLNSSDATLEDTAKLEDTVIENTQTIIDTPDTNTDEKKSLPSDNTNTGDTLSMNNSNKLMDSLQLSTGEAMPVETSAVSTSEDISLEAKSMKDESRKAELVEELKPVTEELCPKDNIVENFSENLEKESVTITETTEDEPKVIKSIVPEPIPSTEEPQDTETVSTKEEVKMSVESNSITELQGNIIATISSKEEDSDTVMETVTSKKEQDAVELMEVDDEETSSMFQQDDEPMEQETAHTSQS